MNTNTTDFTLPKYGYLAFDALTMKSLIKERLTNAGVFTDHNFEGSNISQIIDIFAYTFHTLIYYLNRTAAEGMFTDSKIYENINRIVKSLGYNPIGCQTSIVTYKMTLKSGWNKIFQNDGSLYWLPRYTSISNGTQSFVIDQDIPFTVPFTKDETPAFIPDFEGKNFAYQGTIKEYPEIIAKGEENEVCFLNPGKNVLIDHFTIDVYVYDSKNHIWEQWEKTPSLYLNNASDEVYEIRLNDNQYYEIRFGNDICGKRLSEGDIVQIYYIESDGFGATVGENGERENGTKNGGLIGSPLRLFSSDRYSEILKDTHYSTNNDTKVDYLSIPFLQIASNTASTYFKDKEGVEDIRSNAPGIFRTQYRLVTGNDFRNYVMTNYANFIHDVTVFNNWDYLNKYIKYFYDHGIMDPNNDGRLMLNQTMFADSCNFNNVYMFAVPKIPNENQTDMNYVTPALKSMILQDMQMVKTLTCEPIILDPIYMAFGIGIPAFKSNPDVTDVDKSVLRIIRNENSKRDSASIKADVISVLQDYFNVQNQTLGNNILLSEILKRLVEIEGVKQVMTERTDDDTNFINGLSFIKYNPYHPVDIAQVVGNVKLDPFQFAYLVNWKDIADHIVVNTPTLNYETVEY